VNAQINFFVLQKHTTRQKRDFGGGLVDSPIDGQYPLSQKWIRLSTLF